MSTIASLLGQMNPTIRPWAQGQREVADARRAETAGETSLRELADLKRKQHAEALLMERIQNDPELARQLFGESIIGSLGTAPGGPPAAGPGPITQSPLGGGAAQTIPAPPDASRFAGVPPQSGGPIPPSVMGQAMPTAVPPQGPGPGGSVLGSLGPQGGMPGAPQGQAQAPQNPVLEMARRDPRAALMLQQQIQAQQQNQLKLAEQQLDWTSKKMGYFGQVLQGVNSPEDYAQAVQEIGRVDAQAAARLPQTYSKQALQPYITQAVDVAKNAELRLKAMHEQTEAAKLGIQLQNAGYQGLGEGVTSILRGLSEEQVKQFGGRTTPAAVAYATEQGRKVAGMSDAVKTELAIMKVNPIDAKPEHLEQAQKNIQGRQVEQRGAEGLAGAQATAQASREARQQQTLSEAFKGETVNLYDTQTGRPLPARMTVADYEKLPQQQVTQLSEDNRKQMENLNNAMPRLEILQKHIDAVYGRGGVLERMSPDDRNIIISGVGITERWIEQATQKYPELKAAQNYIDANAESLARALSGVRGAATEGDVERAKAMLPNLTTTLQVWPPRSIGIKLPDTQAVALRTMNNLTDTLNGIGVAILGNPEYSTPLKRYPTLTQTPGMVSPGAGLPPAPSATPAPAPAPQPPAAAVPAPGAPIFPPAPAIRIPGEEPAPTGTTAPTARPTQQAPAPPTATSTPAQDEAYRQSQGQGRPPAPAAPTPRPSPGRQSQARPGASAVRLAGGPKYMELADVVEAMRQTGKSRREVEAAARSRGYTVYGSKRPLPEETAIG